MVEYRSHSRIQEELSPTTGSFLLSVLGSSAVFPLFLSFSLASSRLDERSRAIIQREGLCYQTECPVNSVPVFGETPFLVVFGAP